MGKTLKLNSFNIVKSILPLSFFLVYFYLVNYIQKYGIILRKQ